MFSIMMVAAKVQKGTVQIGGYCGLKHGKCMNSYCSQKGVCGNQPWHQNKCQPAYSATHLCKIKSQLPAPVNSIQCDPRLSEGTCHISADGTCGRVIGESGNVLTVCPDSQYCIFKDEDHQNPSSHGESFGTCNDLFTSRFDCDIFCSAENVRDQCYM
eukprot:NODE_274_length_10990_cov_0.767606.p9 type:complete len:158 gc:universal NODE_274_length_10990_cov_0.767606:7432-6959(-)